MELIPTKSRIQLVREVIDYINSRYPSADLSPGLVFRDLLVEAPMQFIGDTVAMTNFIGQILDLSALEQLVSDPKTRIETATALGIDQTAMNDIITKVIELYAANYNIVRRVGTYASGVLTFYSIEKPTDIIRIPAGTIVRVPNTGISFQTIQNAVLDGNNLDFNRDYDTLNNRWFVKVSAQCTIVGSIGNVPANSITQIDDTSIKLSVTNEDRFTGGTNSEDDYTLLTRIKRVYRGNFQGTADSLLANVLAYSGVRDAVIAYLPNDPNKIDDSINSIDIFVYANNRVNLENSLPVTSNFNSNFIKLSTNYVSNIRTLAIPQDNNSDFYVPSFAYSLSYTADGTSYISFSYIKDNYISVLPYSDNTYSNNSYKIKLVLNGDPQNPIYGSFPDFSDNQYLNSNSRLYVFVNQDGNWIDTTSDCTYKKDGNDQAIILTGSSNSPVIALKIHPKSTDIIKVNYDYDSVISDLSTYLFSSSRKFVGQNIYLYPATPVGIIAKIKIQVDPSYGTADREAMAKQKYIELLNSYRLGAELNQTAFVSEFLKIDGIVDVKIPFDVFTRDQDTRTGSNDIILSAKEYPVILKDADIQIIGTYEKINI